LIQQPCRVATAQEEGGWLGALLRQVIDKDRLAPDVGKQLLQGARLTIVN
jgi:hypothetical protein